MTNRHYRGTRAELTLRVLIAPAVTSAADDARTAADHGRDHGLAGS
jgi:hypothetical protein